jgi:DNA primase catalytic subunit
MVDWRTDFTQCIARKKDGARCRVGADPLDAPEDLLPPGEALCEHHRYHVDAFIEDPLHVASMYQRYFPKEHHPACDRKGQNDCDCPDRDAGRMMGLALKRSCQTSLEMSLPHRRWKRLEMRKRTRLIREYYNAVDVDDLWLPPTSNWRQLRFFVWDEKQQRMRVKKIRDNFRHKEPLLKWLRNLAPHHVYYSTSKWTNAECIGPDPYSRAGASKYRKRHGLLKWTYDQWLGQEMFFDVDYEMPSFVESAQETKRLAEYYRTLNFKDCEHDLMFVFSGGKGFHMIDWGFDLEKASGGAEEWLDARKKVRLEHKQDTGEWPSLSYAGRMLSKKFKEYLIRRIRQQGILLDYEVTVDPRRIIRLPGTVHGKQGRVCRIIDETELDDFDPGQTLW